MSIWGKLVGGGVGLAFGGPIGGLLGALAGHAVDIAAADWVSEGGALVATPRDETRHIAFTIGVIALSAKMAKVDGRVTHNEVDAFRQVFHVPPHELKNVARVFDLAKRDAAGFEPYAAQLAQLLRNRPAVLEEVLDCLFHIARADGHVGEAEIGFLRAVADIFGFTPTDFHRIAASNGVDPTLGGDTDPYAVLGLPKEVANDDARAAWKRLVREHHPDRLTAQGLPPEFITIATEKLARINAAWDRVAKERGLK
ncbi:MAG: djlA [Rhodospirillales bacterium]|jgi:DnaJ like chaperone protein|nr:djlA [Rhodospirillales bacterium]